MATPHQWRAPHQCRLRNLPPLRGEPQRLQALPDGRAMTASGKRSSEQQMHGSIPTAHAHATTDPSAVMVPKAPPLASIHLAHDPLPTPGHHTAAESLANTRRPQRPDHRVPWQEPGDRNERAGGSLPWSPTTSAWPQPRPATIRHHTCSRSTLAKSARRRHAYVARQQHPPACPYAFAGG